MALIVSATVALGACGSAPFTVGVALDGALGDNAFNDGAAAGLARVESEFGYETVLQELDGDADFEAALITLAEDCDLVYGVGFFYSEPVAAVAPDYPDTRFVVIDGSVYDDPNTTSIQFAAEQGSYLVGIAAAEKSAAGHVGFIGGIDIPVIGGFLAGYQAGVEATTPSATIDVEYVGAFDDPDGAKAIATTMFTGGADVVFHAAGGSGLGLFEAAQEYSVANSTHVWAIGVDVDQYEAMGAIDEALPPYILTSMLKRVDNSIFITSEQEHDGTLESGTVLLSLADDGVGYATSGGFIDDIAADLQTAAAAIIDGTIEVPTEP